MLLSPIGIGGPEMRKLENREAITRSIGCILIVSAKITHDAYQRLFTLNLKPWSPYNNDIHGLPVKPRGKAFRDNRLSPVCCLSDVCDFGQSAV